jgi:hypothetical protein
LFHPRVSWRHSREARVHSRVVRLAWALAATVTAAAFALPPSSLGQTPGETPPPIPSDPVASGIPTFSGRRATPHRVAGERVPRHPFMAPNGRSNIHADAYQSDSYRRAGPLGPDISVRSALFTRECASVTFDSAGRLVTICVGLDRPVLTLLDPTTLRVLAAMNLPPRTPGGGTFTDFSGGGYFYLDQRDRAVVPTTNRHIYVVAERPGPRFALVRDYDLTGAVPGDDAIISALPDWHGRLWFATKGGRVGTVTRRSRQVRVRPGGAPIGNSFVENNYGYEGPSSVVGGATTSPGLERVAIGRRGCHRLWTSDVRSPSAVAKLSLAAGLVYTYSKPDLGTASDPWYLTAIDFRTGKTVYSRLAGAGLGYNNNFAPVTVAPGGHVAYVGALGGIVRFADAG